jgi:hypothetical protein
MGIYAQNDRNYILRMNLGGHISHRDFLVSQNNFLNTYRVDLFGETLNNWNFNFSGGKSFKSNYYFGLGFFFDLSKKEFKTGSNVPNINYSVLTNKVIGPLIFFQYFTQISDRFTIAIELNSKYYFNQENGKTKTLYPGIPRNSFQRETEIIKQNISFGLLPSLRYNIVKNFGLELTFGLFAYKQKLNVNPDIDPEIKTKGFVMDFKPDKWLIGVYQKF